MVVISFSLNGQYLSMTVVQWSLGVSFSQKNHHISYPPAENQFLYKLPDINWYQHTRNPNCHKLASQAILASTTLPAGGCYWESAVTRLQTSTTVSLQKRQKGVLRSTTRDQQDKQLCPSQWTLLSIAPIYWNKYITAFDKLPLTLCHIWHQKFEHCS